MTSYRGKIRVGDIVTFLDWTAMNTVMEGTIVQKVRGTDMWIVKATKKVKDLSSQYPSSYGHGDREVAFSVGEVGHHHWPVNRSLILEKR